MCHPGCQHTPDRLRPCRVLDELARHGRGHAQLFKESRCETVLKLLVFRLHRAATAYQAIRAAHRVPVILLRISLPVRCRVQHGESWPENRSLLRVPTAMFSAPIVAPDTLVRMLTTTGCYCHRCGRSICATSAQSHHAAKTGASCRAIASGTSCSGEPTSSGCKGARASARSCCEIAPTTNTQSAKGQ